MDATIKRVVFTDEWIPVSAKATLGKPLEFRPYALGWRFEATPRELKLIHRNNLFGHQALVLREGDIVFTWNMVLGPELIPEVQQSNDALLKVEGQIRAAAARWTHFFASMDDPVG